MEEILHNIDPLQPANEEQLEIMDINQVVREFEEKWNPFRKSHVLITQENGDRKELATYAIPFDEHRSVSKNRLIDFATQAMILGYRSAIGSILVPEDNPTAFQGTPKNMRILFFLEPPINTNPLSDLEK